MPEKSNKYQASRNDDINNNETSDSNKKAAKVIAKGAADYFSEGKGGALVDKLSNTNLGDKVLDTAGKALDKQPGFSKVAKKLDDIGALDLADKGLSVVENIGTGETENVDGKDLLKAGSTLANKNSGNKSSNKNTDTDVEKSSDDIEDNPEVSFNDIELESSKFKISTPILLTISVSLFFIFIISISVFTIINNFKTGSIDEKDTSCSMFSMTTTSLSESEFVSALNNSANLGIGYSIFSQNASTIYNMSVNNNINPELVIARAAREGFSPGGGTNNYWGLGCTNTGGSKACINYSSFSQGLLGYINNISKYSTVEEMMSKYAYIGNYWYSPGSSSLGGCYYYPYIKKYLSAERSAQIENACSKGCSGNSCTKTTDEDQNAYASWQVEKMVDVRKSVFGVGEDSCESKVSGTGSEIVQYATNTFDSFSYSQANRMGPSSVDCSSLVWRTYQHFNINFGSTYALTAQGEYDWCNNNNKLISESQLQPGDLIFWYHGKSTMQHVAIYAGENKQFAAHTDRYAQPDQVSVSSYNKGSGDRFCRPY